MRGALGKPERNIPELDQQLSRSRLAPLFPPAPRHPVPFSFCQCSSTLTAAAALATQYPHLFIYIYIFIGNLI